MTSTNGYPIYLNSSDSKSLKDYIENYQSIAKDDLESSIVTVSTLCKFAHKMANIISDLDKNIKICDVGSDKGYLIDELVKKGFANITAVDIVDIYFKSFHSDVNFCIANAENLPFDNEFAVIFATDVMEHVFDIGSFLYCVNLSLVRNGLFIIRVPNQETLLHYSHFLNCKYKFVHLRSFVPNIIRPYLREAGFSIKRIEHFSYATGGAQRYIDLFSNDTHQKLFEKIGKFLLACYPSLNIVDESDFLGFFHKLFVKTFIRSHELLIVAEKIHTI